MASRILLCFDSERWNKLTIFLNVIDAVILDGDLPGKYIPPYPSKLSERR